MPSIAISQHALTCSFPLIKHGEMFKLVTFHTSSKTRIILNFLFKANNFYCGLCFFYLYHLLWAINLPTLLMRRLNVIMTWLVHRLWFTVIILLCFVSLEFSIALWNESSWFYGIKPKQKNCNKSLNALEVIGHTEWSLCVSVFVILIFFIERNEIYYYEQLHKRANTISIRFIDTGKIYRRKRMWKEFQHFVR